MERIDVAGRTAKVENSVTLGEDTLAMSFDPAGRRVLYLKGHGPIALWIGTIESGRLTHVHRLLRNVQLDAVGW